MGLDGGAPADRGGVTAGTEDRWFLELAGRSIPLAEGALPRGRSPGGGVVLQDPSVSRGHALLFIRAGKVTLQDLRSSNGTYVNGRRLQAETEVAEGDRMVLGETEIFLRR